MANAFTDAGGGASLGVNLVQAAYDRYVEFALRAMPLYRNLADKRPVQQAMPGSSVVFQLYQDLPKVTGTLSETVDPDSVAVPSTVTKTVTLAEYGEAQLKTRKLQLFSLSDVDPAVADMVAFNIGDSLDDVVRDILVAGTNVIRENAGAMLMNSGTTGAVAATDTFKSRDARAAVARLRGSKAVPRFGNLFAAFVHPDVAYDLRSETGAAAWRDPHNYSGAGNIWEGTLGIYEGAVYTETPRSKFAADGATAARVHRTLFAGKQALAEAVAEEPHVVIGPVTDKLNRFRPIGWYGVLGWARFREEALLRVESSATLIN